MSEFEELSSSKFQSQLEKTILEKIRKSKRFAVSRKEDLVYEMTEVGEQRTKFQIDVYSPKHNLIGEIYATDNVLNSGRKRKVSQDFLKLLTFEKMKKKKFEKFYLFILPTTNLSIPDSKIEIILPASHFKNFNILGANSWLSQTTELFKISVYYYFLKKEDSNKLLKKRDEQKEGMKK